MDLYYELVQYLENNLSPQRLKHSLEVSRLAEKIGTRYSLEPWKCRIAGLAHDMARDLPRVDLVRKALTDGKEIHMEEYDNPILLHGRAAAGILEQEFFMRDEEILNAVREHITGKPGMSLLSKIVFATDFLEPTRDWKDQDGEIATLRKGLYMGNIDTVLKEILHKTFEYLKQRNLNVAESAEKLYLELMGNVEESKKKI